MKIALTSIYVDSPDKAYTFYTDVLGFVKKMYIPEASLAIVVSPEEPEGTALLLEPNTSPVARDYQKALYDAGLPSIVFGVEDIDEEYNRLKALGVVFRGRPTETEWGTYVLFEDTCGNLIHLHQGE